jgi:2-succinyl-5-enolpyruvyl-6-hydroxy-3-cyclohexene-1-carboxylate synthase
MSSLDQQPGPVVAATFCATLVDEWARAGITDAVVCPGSRSTPLSVALAEDERIRVHVHHDERSAGYVALGLALASGRPAVVVTTSGTAAVELHPAVVEAHHAKVPLLAVTADRPAELRGVGAPQTIDQTGLFGAAVRWFADPGVPDAASAGQWRSLAARAVLAATEGSPGPVHLNLPFREPLLAAPVDLPPPRAEGGPWHGRGAAVTPPADIDVASLADAVARQRGIIVAGAPIDRPEPVHTLAAMLGWPVLAEPRSGCRLPREATISHADALLRSERFARSHRPDVVLRLGSLPASKVLGQWLAGLDGWQIGVERDGSVFDPDGTLNALLTVEPAALCQAVAEAIGPDGDARSPGDWYREWVHADAEAAAALADVLSRRPAPTEPAIARDVVAAVPAGGNLVVSSSMPIRDVEWFAAPREAIRVFANRGANGIDGVVSTAVGVALASGAPTVLLIGDVALLHDTNGLLGLAGRPLDLCIVAIDNDGGGIFEFLPPAERLDRARFEQLFGTPHGVDLAGLAGAHGIGSTTVADQPALVDAIGKALAAGGPHLVVVPTDRRQNVEVHQACNDAVVAAVDRLG